MDRLPMNPEPTWRKPVGMGLILLLITVWAAIVASLATYIGVYTGTFRRSSTRRPGSSGT